MNSSLDSVKDVLEYERYAAVHDVEMTLPYTKKLEAFLDSRGCFHSLLAVAYSSVDHLWYCRLHGSFGVTLSISLCYAFSCNFGCMICGTIGFMTRVHTDKQALIYPSPGYIDRHGIPHGSSFFHAINSLLTIFFGSLSPSQKRS